VASDFDLDEKLSTILGIVSKPEHDVSDSLSDIDVGDGPPRGFNEFRFRGDRWGEDMWNFARNQIGGERYTEDLRTLDGDLVERRTVF